MQTLVISGSRNREGQTARAIKAIGKGIAEAGGNSETVFLPECKIERCRQCDPNGWGQCRREGNCVIEDDFSQLVDKISRADVVVFANPVYFGDLTESMRAFLDRLRRIRFPRVLMQRERGQTPPATPAIGYCYAGGSGNGTATCCASLERILQICGFDVVDMILARRQNLETKIPILELTGKWLVSIPTSGPPLTARPR